ncbi:MAG: glycerate kinase [Tumebacillaceae bacterium]
MRIVIAPDSWKGSLSSTRGAQVIERAIRELLPDCEIVCLPVADGGEGTVDALLASLGGERVLEQVQDPLGRTVEAYYGWVEAKRLAIVETSAASGLALLQTGERDPKVASTYGTGQLLRAALDRGAKQVILGLGGSATVDAGTGLLEALGVVFYDQAGQQVRGCGGALGQIAAIDASKLDARLADVEIIVASDVTNPLLGQQGAVAIFGPQKGVTGAEMSLFENAMEQFADVVCRTTGTDVRDAAGSGAAGGLGFALQAFLTVQMRSGFEIIATQADLENKIASAQLVITGEGKFDAQSLFGKVPVGIARIAKKLGVPTVVFAGMVEGDFAWAEREGISLAVPIVDGVMTLEEAMNDAEELLHRAVQRFVRTLLLATKCGLIRSK